MSHLITCQRIPFAAFSASVMHATLRLGQTAQITVSFKSLLNQFQGTILNFFWIVFIFGFATNRADFIPWRWAWWICHHVENMFSWHWFNLDIADQRWTFKRDFPVLSNIMPVVPAMVPMITPDPAGIKLKLSLARGAGNDQDDL